MSAHIANFLSLDESEVSFASLGLLHLTEVKLIINYNLTGKAVTVITVASTSLLPPSSFKNNSLRAWLWLRGRVLA